MLIYADLHIHVGRSLDGKSVKVTASSCLTLPEILRVAREIKGLGMIAVVDSHSYGVQNDYKELLQQNLLQPLPGGGYDAGGLVVLPAVETELAAGEGSAHFLAYFPDLACIRAYVDTLKPHVRNWQLSTQKMHLDLQAWIATISRLGGIWMTAHSFTPHKGIYGNCCRRLADVLPVLPNGVEIGLSADRSMAKMVSELEHMPLFSNSDAHSAAMIGREFNALTLNERSFAGFEALVREKRTDCLINYGLYPRLGKYHLSASSACGVADRLAEIADREETSENAGYVYHVPLCWLPGLGPVKYRRLLEFFSSELTVMYAASKEELLPIVGEETTNWIIAAREGRLKIQPGSGGVYGKIQGII